MSQFRKKPVVIEAKQATGTPESNREIIYWTRGSATPAFLDDHPDHDGLRLNINTLEGAMWVTPGDWIIKGVKGEFYPCKPDIFEATYQAAGIAPPPENSPIEQEIAVKASNGPRVTRDDIEAEIASVHYFVASDAIQHENAVHEHDTAGWLLGATQQLTFCVIQLRNGFTVTGESACASPENFNAEIGRRIARENAVNKMWLLLGFRLKDNLHALANGPT